jgi:serine/threonine protein phosphatase PrpC
MKQLEIETIITEAPTVGRISSQRSFDGLPTMDLNRLPAVRSEAGWVGGTWIQAASVVGRSHRQNGTASSGQDVYGYLGTEEPDQLTVMAVADGLGSKPRSHIGATLAVRIACDEMRQLGSDGLASSDEQALVDLGARVNARLLAATREHWDEVGTTLLACAVVGGQAGRELVAIRIGDPVAYVLTAAKELRPVWTAPPDAQSALNLVGASIPQPDPAITVEVARMPLEDDTVGLILLSDGVANDVDASSEIQLWCVSRWSMPLDSFGMADSLRYQRQGSGDDRTAVVLLLHPDSNVDQRADWSTPPVAAADSPATAEPDADEPQTPVEVDEPQTPVAVDEPQMPVVVSGAGLPGLAWLRRHLLQVVILVVLLAGAVALGRWTSGG